MAGNFWPRKLDEARFPATRRVYEVDSTTSIAVFEHQPLGQPRGQLVFIHGLEGSADAGYIKSFAQNALTRGFGVHRTNLRSCGGTEELCRTMYHSGLTGDTRLILDRIYARDLGPIFLIGFSLGGNVALKLAGELGDTKLLAGACAVSTPIDLAACVRRLDLPSNRVYAYRFLDRLKARVRRKSRLSPDLYQVKRLDEVRTVWQFDDLFTAPLFGFGTAANYYATQSSARFLHLIRVPTLVITAQDDPLVPFSMYRDPVFDSNPAITLLAPSHGGHLGFLSRGKPRFWLDEASLRWIQLQTTLISLRGTNISSVASGSLTT
ncbi:MAG TPA: alpha/beta fold hydrolase [Bryobacteraceae bacterium]|jgi:hypothetical protein|nr:alpha/beta fold hydrolase [Bryobacteraceae bacterium]